MSFLTESDFPEVIKSTLLGEIIEDENSALTEAIETSIAEMASYLSNRFDVENIFNKTGNDRNKLLVLYGMDIALYHLHARIDPIQIPEIRRERYKNAIETLKAISTGEINPIGLPPLITADGQEETGSRFGSDKPLITKY